MIASFKQLPNGEMEYHTFCAFSSSSPSTKSSRHKFDLASTRPARSVPNTPGSTDAFGGQSGPVPPDISTDNGKTFCSIHGLCRHAGVSDSGFALDAVARKTITPDTELRGLPCWIAGASADQASAKLKTSFAAAQQAKQQQKTNRRPVAVGTSAKPLN